MIGRIHGRQAFVRFRTEGRRFSAGDLWCVYVEDQDLDEPRVAFAIGRSVGPAVTRNLLRRRLRHALGEHGSRWAPGWYLLGARPIAVTRSYQELDAMLQQLLNRITQGARR